MATTECKPGQRLHQQKNILPSHPTHEDPWQELMVVTYLVHETLELMRQEQTERHQPLNDSWQLFIGHLYRRKPTLKRCLENLYHGFFAQENRP